eukprot:PITA_34402
MQKKSETYSKFCEFKALVEKESGKKVKDLRSDNGGKYISDEFKDFCKAEGIRRELIAPHNPKQNGVVERKNRTIVGAAQAMLHDQGLPLHLWAEVCNTAVYVQNRCPHKILGMSTPEEAYSEDEVHGVEETTHAAPTIRGQKRLTEAERLAQDAEKVVGTPTAQCRQRQSPHRYTGYMALMSKCVVTEPSSFEEVVEDLAWVNTMVEEYDSIVRNSAWEIVPRLEGKSMAGSRRIYKVKQADDGSVEKYKARFFS